jgi:hypothetical protein
VPIFTSRWHTGPTPPPQPHPQILRQAGPLVAVQVEVPTLLAKYLSDSGKPVPPPVTGWALIDTGATSTAVNEGTAVALGVCPVGTAKVGTAGGSQDQPVFPLKITLPQIPMAIEYEQVTGAKMDGMPVVNGKPLILLIGRDVLERMVFIYDGPNGQITLGF